LEVDFSATLRGFPAAKCNRVWRGDAYPRSLGRRGHENLSGAISWFTFLRAEVAKLRPRPEVAVLAEEHQLTKRAGEALLGDLVSLITKHLKKGERVRIAGLGILQVRKRAARMGRNPATGEAIQIKASKKVAFRAAKDLKMAV
jgi:DNA-binding protein HU-beta